MIRHSGKSIPSFRRQRRFISNSLQPTPVESKTLRSVICYGTRGTGEVRETPENFLIPYITYLAQWLRQDLRGNPVRYGVAFFGEVVNYFSENPGSTINQFLNERTGEIRKIIGQDDEPSMPNGSQSALGDFSSPATSQDWAPFGDATALRVSETVYYISLWLMMPGLATNFGSPSQLDKYRQLPGKEPEDMESGDFDVAAFVESCDLIPKIEAWVQRDDPREDIPAKKLNAKLLDRVAGVKFEKLGYSAEYAQEILRSYRLLFGARCSGLFKDLWNDSAFPEPKDPYLQELCFKGYLPTDAWRKDKFHHLWPRIKFLQQYLKDIEPDSFLAVVYRDRRNSYIWYTSMFALAVLVLTFFQTVASVIQATKAFLPSNPPGAGVASKPDSPASTAPATPTSHELTSSSSNASNMGLTTGSIVGITLGSVAGVLVVAGFLIRMRTHKLKNLRTHPDD